MKHMKLWIAIMLIVTFASSVLIVVAYERYRMLSSVRVDRSTLNSQTTPWFPQHPENATIIPELNLSSFHINLESREIMLSRGQSTNITVTIYSMNAINISLRIGTEETSPGLALISPESTLLPQGIVANFNETEKNIDAKSATVVTLMLSVQNDAALGIYKLKVFAIEETFHGYVATGTYLKLIIT